jgi:NTP pyrophosphatase (non-canonical NTP hydrolase)
MAALNPDEQMLLYEGCLLPAFAGRMLRVLRDNATQKPGHRDLDPLYLTVKLLEEAGEVGKMIRLATDYRTNSWQPLSVQRAERIARECADVANIAMMLADLAHEAAMETQEAPA